MSKEGNIQKQSVDQNKSNMSVQNENKQKAELKNRLSFFNPDRATVSQSKTQYPLLNDVRKKGLYLLKFQISLKHNHNQKLNILC